MIAGTCRVELKSAKPMTIYQKPSIDITRENYDTVQYEYVLRYGQVIDDVNKQLSDWNEEWNGYYSGDMEEGDIWWNLYGQFLAAKENMLCSINNMTYPESRIKMAAINRAGEPKIIGILDNNPDIYFETFFNAPEFL